MVLSRLRNLLNRTRSSNMTEIQGFGSETKPVKLLEELLNWDSNGVGTDLVGQKLELKLVSGRKGPKMLVCHDMAGGFLRDRFSQGYLIKNPDGEDSPYFISHWWYMDTFVYFSHHFITIPPVAWINAAHKHGVTVLGTVITEWEEGKTLCEQLFGDPWKVQHSIEKLVHIAVAYNFDGWLINIENTIKMEHLPVLHGFLTDLTKTMRSVVGESAKVIWYDSVINSSGRLKWQDELNALNKSFFDCCDGIFLNYCWKDSSLRYTSEVVEAIGRNTDVYVGVDAFGRGCLGGGGFNCCEALQAIEKHRLSAALFAPGFCYEKFDKCDFQANSHRFWNAMSCNLKCRPVTQLPLKTEFGAGFYQKPEGIVFDLGVQELQPHFMCSPPGGASVSFRHTSQGSLELRVNGKQQDKAHLRLFCTVFEVPAEFSTIRIDFQYSLRDITVQEELKDVHLQLNVAGEMKECGNWTDAKINETEVAQNARLDVLSGAKVTSIDLLITIGDKDVDNAVITLKKLNVEFV